MSSFMRMSSVYAPTLKEDPAEAELASHKLLLRAGMIRRTGSGIYNYLPLAWRSIKKIETIVREEMDGIGAQEMMMPILTPGELWHESGRWDDYGPELMRIDDRHDHSYCLGPTHEETVTDLVRNELRSYRQLPVTLYQIQTKFRDELRPRFGLMRGREFIMKDGYSFSANQESLQEIYDDMKDAYTRIFERCGLKALPVAADSGQIGGDTSVEHMVLADAGEASLVWCDCGFAADDEAATGHIQVAEGPISENGACEKISTPGAATIETVAEYFGVPASATRKSIAIVDGEGKPVVAIIPGDHELCEVKAEHAFGDYHMMSDEELEQYGLVKGYIGPVGAPEGIRIVADPSLTASTHWLVGGNEADTHYIDAQLNRDFAIDEWIDLATIHEGDGCPVCGKPLHAARGIEVSHVFQLGTKYSKALGATFMDENGEEQPLIMGCYGVGISRTLAAAVEQSHDDDGIIWPVSIAPYEVAVIPLDVDDDLVWPAAERVANELAQAGIETVVDDRSERPGVKFADNDLYGFPFQLVFGKRAVGNGMCELKIRATGERSELPIQEAAATVAEMVRAGRL